MKDEVKPADIPVQTFAECMEKLHNFSHMRLDSGSVLLKSSDTSTRVIFAYGRNTLGIDEISEILEALDFQPAEIAKINAHLGKKDVNSGISLKKTLETLDYLSKIPHPRHKQSEETLKWMDELFKRLDAEREEYLKSQNS